MQKGSLDVKLPYVPVEGGGKVQYGAEGFKSDGGGGSLVIVNAILLSKTFCHVADFVANDFSCFVMFAFADKLAFEGSLSTWNVRARHQNKYLQVL